MLRVRNVLLVVTVLTSMRVSGQGNPVAGTRFTVGYFGETLSHVGLNVGMEYSPLRAGKYRMILATNVGGYVHRRNNTSLFVRGQWGQRVTFDSGLFVDQFMGLGYLHQFTHGGAQYEVLPNGAVVGAPNSGRPMIMPSISLGTGYDFSKENKKRPSIYLRPELFWKAPFNGYYLTHFALSTGLLF